MSRPSRRANIAASIIALAVVAAFALSINTALSRAQPVAASCSPACKARVKARDRHQAVERRVKRELEVIAPYRGWLGRVRSCESHGNYRAVSPSGTYTGAYQFDDPTWRSVGGTGRALDAGRLEQDYRAVLLRKRRGTAPWPVCG